MVTKEECFKQLREVIDAVLSTVDKEGNPQSRIIDIMHIEDDKIYFLTVVENMYMGKSWLIQK